MTTFLTFLPLIMVTIAGAFACILIFFGDIDEQQVRHARHKSKHKHRNNRPA